MLAGDVLEIERLAQAEVEWHGTHADSPDGVLGVDGSQAGLADSPGEAVAGAFRVGFDFVAATDLKEPLEQRTVC